MFIHYDIYLVVGTSSAYPKLQQNMESIRQPEDVSKSNNSTSMFIQIFHGCSGTYGIPSL